MGKGNWWMQNFVKEGARATNSAAGVAASLLWIPPPPTPGWVDHTLRIAVSNFFKSPKELRTQHLLLSPPCSMLPPISYSSICHLPHYCPWLPWRWGKLQGPPCPAPAVYMGSWAQLGTTVVVVDRFLLSGLAPRLAENTIACRYPRRCCALNSKLLLPRGQNWG